MRNDFNWPLWHWHFELTSACTLKCPRCSRTEKPETLVRDNLDLNFFKENFTKDILQETKRVTFCGYDGDPIYNKEFIEICEYFKSNNQKVELNIVTNGSYKKTDWWLELGKTLNKYDQIHFSLDGYDQESNEKYRVNSNWNSIIEGIETLRIGPVRLVWDMIYFSFNYKHVDHMVNLAQELGFDAMRQTKSNKFNFFYEHYDDSLDPIKEYISESGRYESNTIRFTDRKIYDDSFKTAREIYKKQTPIGDITPYCFIGTKGLFVDSRGYFYPCCWIIDRYNDKAYAEWQTEDKNIKQSGLESVLNTNYWTQFIANIPKLDICKLKCKSTEINEETVMRF